jgi:hypothetical protein
MSELNDIYYQRLVPKRPRVIFLINGTRLQPVYAVGGSLGARASVHEVQRLPSVGRRCAGTHVQFVSRGGISQSFFWWCHPQQRRGRVRHRAQGRAHGRRLRNHRPQARAPGAPSGRAQGGVSHRLGGRRRRKQLLAVRAVAACAGPGGGNGENRLHPRPWRGGPPC